MNRSLIALLVASFGFVPGGALAAASAVALSPLKSSVAAGESQVFSAKFLDAAGNPSVGETVSFTNDACGRFPNGQFFATALTDANGVASLNFTALQAGSIGCTLFMSAGAQVRFTILTYPLSTAYVTATLDPPEPMPGEPFRIVGRAKVGIYDLYNVDVAARIVPGTASAAISPGSESSGQEGRVYFNVAPDGRMGDYQVELEYRGHTQRTTIKPPENPWQDLWWSGAAENGWGMSIVQHRDLLFSIIYAYDEAGQPVWYVVPSGAWNEAHTSFSGAAYLPRGAPYTAYDTSKFDIGASIGSVTITFDNRANEASLDYSLSGITGHKAITRIPFGGGSAAARPGLGDLWWAGVAQNGWGLSVLQHGPLLFSLWFTYDAQGKATWFAMPEGFWLDANTYQGRIYRPTGSPWLGHAYDPAQQHMTDMGSYQLRFADDGTATFNYFFLGGSLSQPITRIPF